MEQLIEQPQAKRVRVANYKDSELEIIQKVTDSDALGHQRSQLRLHGKISTLAQYSPAKASLLVQKHIMELSLEMEKLKRKMAEKQWASKAKK